MRTLSDVAPSPLRRMRWSATASALAAVVAMFGATALASSLMAGGEAGRGRSSTKADLAAVASVAAGATTTTRPPLVATTSVARKSVRPPTTTEPAAAPAPPALPANGILRPVVTATDVWFETSTGSGDPCGDFELWRVARPHPEALVAVTSDRRRLEGIDASTGEVLAVLATWDDENGRPVGDGVVDLGGGALPAVSPDGSTLAFARGRGCAPEVVLRDLATGAERTVSEGQLADPAVTGLHWTADGSTVEVVEGSSVLAVSPSGEDVASIVDGELVVSRRAASGESPVTRLPGYADVAW